MDEGFVKFVVGIFAVFAAIYVMMVVVFVGMVVASLALGFVSVFIVKSRKALIRQQDSGAAISMALGWASVVTAGCLAGSFGLIITASALDPSLQPRMMSRLGIEVTDSFWGFWRLLDRWLMASAYAFFAKTVAALYLANRVFLARSAGGALGLGILPPVLALLVFLVVDHWALLIKALLEPTATNINGLLEAFWPTIWWPFEFVSKVLTGPDALWTWLRDRVIASEGNMFKLASFYFPGFFWMIAAALVCQAAVGSVSPVAE